MSAVNAGMKYILSVRMHCWLVIIVMLGLTCVVSAQEKIEPAEREVRIALPVHGEQKAPLPKIENTEFVITGQETIELPVAVKGDASEERSYEPPFPSAGGKELDIGRTATKLMLRNANLSGVNGRLYGMFGSYISPSLGALYGKSFPEGSITGDARYAASHGYADNTQWQSYAIGVAGAYTLNAVGTTPSSSRWKSAAGMGGESYRAFGSSHPEQQRTQNDLDFSIGYDSRYVSKIQVLSPIDYSAGFSWVRTSLSDSGATAVENEFGLVTAASGQYETLPVRATFEYRMSDESMPKFDTRTMHWLVTSVGASIMATTDVDVSCAVALSLFRGNETPTSLRLYPRITARYGATRWMTLRGGFEPAVTRTSFRTMVKGNKYSVYAIPLRPSDIPIEVNVGADVLPLQDVSCSVTMEYKRLNEYPSFADTQQTRLWSVVYLPSVRVWMAGFRLRYAPASANAVTGFIVLNSTTHTDSTVVVPFVPVLTAGVVYRHSFLTNMSAEVSAEYIGKRYTDFTASMVNAAYCLLSVKGEYSIADNLRVSAEILNILNQQYYVWNGYRERRLFMQAGIIYFW